MKARVELEAACLRRTHVRTRTCILQRLSHARGPPFFSFPCNQSELTRARLAGLSGGGEGSRNNKKEKGKAFDGKSYFFFHLNPSLSNSPSPPLSLPNSSYPTKRLFDRFLLALRLLEPRSKQALLAVPLPLGHPVEVRPREDVLLQMVEKPTKNECSSASEGQ